VATTAEDVAVSFNTTQLASAASDVDGDTLSVGAIASQPLNGNATLNADGTITYTPNPNFNGEDTFTYTLVDGKTGSVVVTATVTISARLPRAVLRGAACACASIARLGLLPKPMPALLSTSCPRCC
jgi:hypothetical protein